MDLLKGNEFRDVVRALAADPLSCHLTVQGIYNSKLKLFNPNYKVLGTTEKKKQEETQTGR